MIDDPYRDADLVELYDLDNPDGEDHAYYRALADEIDARSIVDLGCGTGLLTRSLVRPDRFVTGVDPSRTMLDYARRQPGAESVTWIHGDASALAPTGTADLAICTGNAMMHISPEALPSTLRSLAGALRSGGTLSFESRNPAYREWERWTPETTYGERLTPVGHLREWLDVTDVREGRVVFDAHNVFPDGEDRIYTSTPRSDGQARLSIGTGATSTTKLPGREPRAPDVPTPWLPAGRSRRGLSRYRR